MLVYCRYTECKGEVKLRPNHCHWQYISILTVFDFCISTRLTDINTEGLEANSTATSRLTSMHNKILQPQQRTDL